jgi:hypothetical protein
VPPLLHARESTAGSSQQETIATRVMSAWQPARPSRAAPDAVNAWINSFLIASMAVFALETTLDVMSR